MITPYGLIQKKRDGEPLSADQIRHFVTGYVRNEIPDYQMSAFLMAVFFRGMTPEETGALTEAMIDSGDRIDPELLGRPTADKHSTGGVGDKISIVLAPLVACTGIRVPMMSGRGLGHTGGTLDKLESIPGFNTRLDPDRMIRQIDRIGVAMIGQTEKLAPADKRMYALRDVTATVNCIPLIAASIMSKKIAAGPQNLVLDVKTGRGAFMTDTDAARQLARAMVQIGSYHHRNVQAILTDMHTQPLGQAVGNSLEIIECIEVLQDKGPADIRELTLVLSSAMMLMAGIAKTETEARSCLESKLSSGEAFSRFLQMVESQDGRPESIEHPEQLPLSPVITDIHAGETGFVHGIDPMAIGLASVELGAGRIRQEDRIDPGAGIWLAAKRGDAVRSGDRIARVYTSKPLPEDLIQRIFNAFEIMPNRPAPIDLVLEKTLSDASHT